MNFTIRKAREDDAGFIRRLFLLPHVSEFLNTPTPEMIVAAMDDSAAENYVVEADAEPAGNLLLRNHGFSSTLHSSS